MAREGRPAALREGDSIAVVAPGAAVDEALLRPGLEQLRRLGFDVHCPEPLWARSGYLAGSDAERARSLVSALRDPAIRGVVLARGGYGCARLLPSLARSLRDLPPKVLVGYSDATALFTLLSDHLGWVCFHGPMVSDLAETRPGDRRRWLRILGGETPEPLRLQAPIRAGEAEGRLAGGCLSVLAASIGTSWAPRTRGAVLFLEDVGEKPYRIDRMLTQLRQAGGLRGVRALVFGEMADCGDPRELRRVIADATAGLRLPIAYGLPSGHGRGKATLPIGARVALADGGRRLVFAGPAVTAQ